MPLGLAVAQQDFSAGMVRAAPHLLPSNSAWLLDNFLLDETGSPYKRGGTIAKSNDALSADGLRFLWDGELLAGHRTVFADPNELAVLAADDETPIGFGTGGMSTAQRPAVLDGILYVGSVAYAGSRLTAGYSTGTVDVTEGDATVVGSGTAWTGALEPGSLLVINNRVVAVASVTDNTHLELALPWPGSTATGQAYAGGPVAPLPAAYHPGAVYAAVGNRLLAAVGTRVYMTVGGDATTWIEDEYHELPAGAVVRGISGLRDVAYLFTTEGVWAVSNIAFDLTDDLGNAQQRLELVAGSMVLWQQAGLAEALEGIVVPALDGVWLFGAGPAVLLSQGIGPLWNEYVRSGYRLGGATVFKSHYIVPVLDESGVITVLACRLDRPVRTKLGLIFPWTTLSGSGATVAAFAGRYSDDDPPELLAVERGVGGLVLRYPDFTPDGLAADHDGDPVLWGFISREIPTGPLNENTVKKVRVRYELVNSTGTAEITAQYGSDERPPSGSLWGNILWGSGYWASSDPVQVGLQDLDGEAPETNGDRPYSWRVNKRMRYFRVRLQPVGASERAVLRSLELFVRPSGRM